MFSSSKGVLIRKLGLARSSLSQARQTLIGGVQYGRGRLGRGSNVVRSLVASSISSTVIYRPSLSVGNLSTKCRTSKVGAVVPNFTGTGLSYHLTPYRSPRRSFRGVRTRLRGGNCPSVQLACLAKRPNCHSSIRSPFIGVILGRTRRVFKTSNASCILGDPVTNPTCTFKEGLGIPVTNFNVNCPKRGVRTPGRGVHLDSFYSTT